MLANIQPLRFAVSYKVYMLDALSPIEWSQAAWRLEGEQVAQDCDRELIHDLLLAHLPKDGLVVDAGCGSGRWALYLRGLGYRMVGVDISAQACRIARRHDAALDLVVADTQRIPFRDASVDAVVSLGVVEHVESGPLESLRELHRILKPGGLLVLDVPYNNLFRRVVANPLQSFMTWRRRRARWKLAFSEYRFDRREVRGFLEATRFEPLVDGPNELLPPKNMGLWADYHNIVFDPFFPPRPEELFVLPGLLGRAAGELVRRVPWLVCSEVVFVARAR